MISINLLQQSITYDHRVWKIGLPVRSAVLKPHAGRLVVGWVTTSESLLLYVYFLFPSIIRLNGMAAISSFASTEAPRTALNLPEVFCIYPWRSDAFPLL